MIINHNLSSLSALNKLNNNNKLAGKAMERLSSGLRINRAADDSAGSSISQKMRGQIRGLAKAQNNIQDGISLIQTAEAGLGSIQNPNLLRMRELCVQALNGTLTDTERMTIQNELNQIESCIDDIANDTEFNNIKVLRPPLEGNPPKYSGKADIVFVIDRTGSMSSKIQNVKNNIDAFIDKMTSQGIEVNIGLITYSEMHGSSDDQKILKYPITTDVGEFKANLDSIIVSGGGDFEESGLEGIADPDNGALSYDFRDDASKQIIMVTDATVHDGSADGDGKSTYDINDVANTLKDNNIKLTLVSDDRSVIRDQFDKLITPTGGEFMDMNTNFSDKLSAYADKIITDSGTSIESEDMPTLHLQVGPNAGNTFDIELFDARSIKLGIKDLLVDPVEEAEKTLEKIDNAIQMISKQRSKFGAYQNSLEHINNNVSNYEYNLTAAESRISDADMAKETMELSKYSILQQAAQAMLTQSNKMTDSILNLIGKWQG